MSYTVDIGKYDRGYYDLKVVKLLYPDFVIGDFNNLSFQKDDYVFPSYEVGVYPDIETRYYIDSLDCFENVFSASSPLYLRQNIMYNSNLYIFDDTQYEIDVILDSVNIYDYFTQEELNDFYRLREFDYWINYNLNAFTDYKSPIAKYTIHFDDAFERIFFNVDTHYGRSSEQFLKLVTFTRKYLNYHYNKPFYQFLDKYKIHISSLKYYLGYQYYSDTGVDNKGVEYDMYSPRECYLFDFRQIFRSKYVVYDGSFDSFLSTVSNGTHRTYSFSNIGYQNFAVPYSARFNDRQIFKFPLSFPIIESYNGNLFLKSYNYYVNEIIKLSNGNEELVLKAGSYPDVYVLYSKEYYDKNNIDYDGIYLPPELADDNKKCCLFEIFK